MPLDPAVRTFLDQLVAMGLPAFETQTVEQARAAIRMMSQSGPPGEPVDHVEDRHVPGPAGSIPVRVYAPAGRRPAPALVYFHGGGWVIGGIDTHDGLCRQLANRAGATVVSVDYRLAPEPKFPAAVADCFAATRWVADNAAALGIDPARLAIGGDSAGGNLTAVVAQLARDRGGPRLRHQVLIYPATDPVMDYPSHAENASGYLLTREAMAWFYGHYLRTPADRTDPLAAPLRARDLAGLPPALVITAEFDPLRDEGEAYARRLEAAGVPTTLTRYDGMIHGFVGLTGFFEQARTAVDHIAGSLRSAFA